MANLSDIARLAGVSLATVSRVVNGTARVAPEKRERILKAMRETGFQPVESAKAFYKQPSSLIGYVIPSLHNLFLNEIGTALEEAAQEKGYQVVVCDSGREPKREWDYIRLLSEMNADGIVITANNDEIEEEIRRCRLPVVVVDRKAGREYEASVSSDNYLGGQLAAEHLVDCGCKRLVHLRGPQLYSSGQMRFQGYMDVCRKWNLEPRFLDCGYDFESGLACAPCILEHFPDTDGILCSSDMTALSVYKYLSGKGIRVPEDIMLVGFDGVRLGRLMTPELTTVVQPARRMGREAFSLLQELIQGAEPRNLQKTVPVAFQQGETTRRK